MERLNYNIFLNEALKQIEQKFNAESNENEFALWFNIEYIESNQLEIIGSVPSSFIKNQLIDKGYKKLVEDKIFELSGQPIKLTLTIKASSKPVSNSDNSTTNSSENKNNSVKTNKENKSSESLKFPQKQKSHPQLLSRYTFDNFVPGDNNAFALASAKAISKNPGKSYNPVLIYGGVGLGKTHLMQAIGNSIYSETDCNIIYVNSENFINQFILALKSNQISEFKKTYRRADVLLIDDIHFLMGKKETQNELFFTFEELYNNNKQMVFTCDRPVSELKDIDERLISRFERGLNVDLQPPKYETRVAILQKKAQIDNFEIIPEVIELIAKNVCSNVRDLEAAFTKIRAYAELLGKQITLEIAQEQLRDMFSAPKQGNINIDIIQKVVANHYNISVADLKSKKRKKSVVVPRQLAIYITRTLTELSTNEIATEFCLQNHSTILYTCNEIEKRKIADPTLESAIEIIIRSIKDYKK